MRTKAVGLPSSYSTLEPSGISITALNSFGTFSPGLTSCQAWLMVFSAAGWGRQQL
ncbi:MAG: hypothetical protein ABR953_08310 [Candidatus Acidiferrales bacterium]